MFKVAHISNGIVTKVTVKAAFTPVPGLVDVTSITCGPGWSYDGTTFAPPVPTAKELADREFAEKYEQDKAAIRVAVKSRADLPPQAADAIMDGIVNIPDIKRELKVLQQMVMLLARKEFKE